MLQILVRSAMKQKIAEELQLLVRQIDVSMGRQRRIEPCRRGTRHAHHQEIRPFGVDPAGAELVAHSCRLDRLAHRRAKVECGADPRLLRLVEPGPGPSRVCERKHGIAQSPRHRGRPGDALAAQPDSGLAHIAGPKGGNVGDRAIEPGRKIDRVPLRSRNKAQQLGRGIFASVGPKPRIRPPRSRRARSLSTRPIRLLGLSCGAILPTVVTRSRTDRAESRRPPGSAPFPWSRNETARGAATEGSGTTSRRGNPAAPRRRDAACWC